MKTNLWTKWTKWTKWTLGLAAVCLLGLSVNAQNEITPLGLDPTLATLSNGTGLTNTLTLSTSNGVALPSGNGIQIGILQTAPSWTTLSNSTFGFNLLQGTNWTTTLPITCGTATATTNYSYQTFYISATNTYGFDAIRCDRAGTAQRTNVNVQIWIVNPVYLHAPAGY